MKVTEGLVVEHTVFSKVFNQIERALPGLKTLVEARLLGSLARLPLLGQRKEWGRLFCWGFDTVRVKGRHYIGPGFSWLWAC